MSINPEDIKWSEPTPDKVFAGESFDSKGKKIGKGGSKQRIKLIEGDERFNIAAKDALDTTKKDFWTSVQHFLRHNSFYQRYVTITVGDKKIDVNINSLAKRLHLAREEAIQLALAASKATNIEGVRKVVIQPQMLKKVLDHYEAVLPNSSILNAYKLKPETLMKIVKRGLEALSSDNAVTQEVLEGEEKKTFTKFEVEGTKYLIEQVENKDDLPRIIALVRSQGKDILLNLNNGNLADFELTSANLSSKNYGEDEYGKAIVSIIHDFLDTHYLGTAVGIEDRDAGFSDLLGETTRTQSSMQRVIGDLAVHHKFSMEEKLSIAGQLLAGGVQMQRCKVNHYAIQPRNIRVGRDASGKVIAQIVHFNHAKLRPEKNEVMIESYVPQVAYSGYAHETFFDKSGKISGEFEQQSRMDVFAMGKTLYELFVAGTDAEKNPVFVSNGNVRPRGAAQLIDSVNIEVVKSALDAAKVPQPIIDIIVKMLDVNKYSEKTEFQVFQDIYLKAKKGRQLLV